MYKVLELFVLMAVVQGSGCDIGAQGAAQGALQRHPDGDWCDGAGMARTASAEAVAVATSASSVCGWLPYAGGDRRGGRRTEKHSRDGFDGNGRVAGIVKTSRQPPQQCGRAPPTRRPL